jgi:hypothetical protein
MTNLKFLTILSILSACFGLASSDFLTDIYGKFFNKQLPKPFGCSFCMAFWGGLAFSIFHDNTFIDSIMVGCVSSVLSSFISKYLNV